VTETEKDTPSNPWWLRWLKARQMNVSWTCIGIQMWSMCKLIE